jgi:hypothetical protein
MVRIDGSLLASPPPGDRGGETLTPRHRRPPPPLSPALPPLETPPGCARDAGEGGGGDLSSRLPPWLLDGGSPRGVCHDRGGVRRASPSRASLSFGCSGGGSGSEAAASGGVAARALRRAACAMRVLLLGCVDGGEVEGAGRGAGAAASVPRTRSEGRRLPLRLARPTLPASSSDGFWLADLVPG